MSVGKEQFGQDHWSTFAYLAHCVVAREGAPDPDKMRTDPKLHPGLCSHLQALMTLADPVKKYPTRLGGGDRLADHDDWSCAEDLVAAGLLVWGGTGTHPVFDLTPEGWRLLALVTRFRRAGVPGRSYADFRPYADGGGA